MQPFNKHTGVAVPLLRDDINTDQIAPVQAPPIRQFVAQPRWEDYEADHWAVQRAMQATSRGNCAAFALRSTWPPSPGTPSAAPS